MVAVIIAVGFMFVIAAALFAPRSPFQIRSRIGKVQRGAFAELVTQHPVYDEELLRALRANAGSGQASPSPSQDESSSEGTGSFESEARARSQVGDVLTAGG